MSTAHHSTRAAEPVGAYAHARRIPLGSGGFMLFLAGIGPRQRGTKVIPGVIKYPDGTVKSYDIEAQVRSCFENVRIVLEESGASWRAIIDVTVFLTDIARDFPTVNRLWAEYFPDPANAPARTTVEIAALPQAGDAPINFEAKVIAMVEK
jgi:2-aminomuconate deaminase